jgi:hypothetical protein
MVHVTHPVLAHTAQISFFCFPEPRHAGHDFLPAKQYEHFVPPDPPQTMHIGIAFSWFFFK